MNLEALEFNDQRVRAEQKEALTSYGKGSDEVYQAQVESERVDSLNHRKLDSLLQKHGLPTQSMIGQGGMGTVWLLVQHADYTYQKEYLPDIKKSIQRGDLSPAGLAYIQDRILMREDKKQIYGTQLKLNGETGQYELYPVRDPDNLNARRNSVGLGPIEEYLEMFGVE